MFGRSLQMGVLRDPVSLIMGGLGAATSIIGGVKNSRTASAAARDQVAAAKAAGKRVTDSVAEQNPKIIEASQNAGRELNTRADLGAQGVATATDRANALLDPTRIAGEEATEELRRNLVAGGDFNRTPTAADIQIDPGYAFRQQQAELALSRGAAARGTVQSGGFQVDLNKKIQGEASQEFQAAFNRFRTTNQDRFNNLNVVAGRGTQAAGTEGDRLIDSGKFGANITTDATRQAGDWDIGAVDRTTQNEIEAQRTAAEYDTQAANADAAGKVASTNYLTGGIVGGVNAGTGAIQQGRVMNLLKNPTAGVATTTNKLKMLPGPKTWNKFGMVA